jgi:3D (Asp-Asp-Asp) domain-containing protein
MTRSAPIPVLTGALLLVLAIGSGAFAPRARHADPLDVPLVATAARDAMRPLFEPPPVPPAAELGRFRLTYYYMPTETERRAQSVQLFTRSCRKIARVSQVFSQKLRMQGGGKLADGRVLIYAGSCPCGSGPCYGFAPRDHEWGTGANDRPLSPFRSVAVDPSRVSIGSLLYIPELDGLTMPGAEPYGGFVHDGCVVADDRGGGIRGKQLDLVTARHTHYQALDRRHRLKRVTVMDGKERCRTFRTRAAPSRGAI